MLSKLCKHCNKEFTTKRKNVVYCSTDCRVNFYKINKRVPVKKYSNCVECGELLSGRQRKYCSKKCIDVEYNKRRKIGGDLYSCKLQYDREYRQKNKDYIKKQKSEYYYSNHEVRKAKIREWARNNKAHKYSLEVARRTKKIKATPNWLSEEHKEEIRLLYKVREFLSEYDGVEYHVDHIIPLRGNGVSGLHVPWNLQIITAKENIKKSNKL